MKIISLFLFVLSINDLNIQSSDKEMFKNTLDTYITLLEETSQYSYESKYTIYLTPEESEQTKGYFIKDKNDIYQKIDFTEMISDGNIMVLVDNVIKSIEVKKSNTERELFKSINVKRILDQFKNVKLTNNDLYFEFTFSNPSSSANPFEKVIMYFDKENSFLSKIEANYLMSVMTSSGKNAKPKLVIENSTFNKLIDKKLNQLKINEVIDFSNQNVRLSSRFEDYKIIN